MMFYYKISFMIFSDVVVEKFHGTEPAVADF